MDNTTHNTGCINFKFDHDKVRMGKGEIGMRRAYGKTVLSIVVFSLVFCLIGTPNASVESVTSTSSPVASRGPRMDHLQIKFYENQSGEFQGLLNNEIDFMDSPLTKDQYESVLGNPDIEVTPYSGFVCYEIAFNNNATDPSHTRYRKAMNYTEFRQAMACLVDKDGLIAGPELRGLGTRIDTPLPRPIFDAWVNFNVSKYDSAGNLVNNYPWDYNETHAREILWNNGWYSHATYPTLANLLAAPLPLPTGSVVYPPGHQRAGQAIDNLTCYIRSDHLPRKAAGEALVAEMTKLGIGTNVTEGPPSVCSTANMNFDYDFYTVGWSFGRYPIHFYATYTPVGIYPGGYNLYMISDANLTYHATMEYPNATSAAMSMSEAQICQEIIVEEAMFVPLYSVKSYYAYRKGWLGVAATKGYGLGAALNYLMLNVQNQNYPSVTTIRYGTQNLPYSINPIFGGWVWEFAVVERIFTGYMDTNPYKPELAGKSPSGGDLPWMAYDWKYELMSNGNANVTCWFRHDITWQDGVPFTVDDFNYTIYIQKTYRNAGGYSDMIHVVDFVKWDDWTCSLYFDVPTVYALYSVVSHIVPEHIYQYIAIPPDAASGTSTTGLNGDWPGKDALPSEILPGAPFTWNQLTGADGGKYTWIGTGMWKYQPGSYVSGAGGGITLDANRDFFLDTPPAGEMDFSYSWNSGSPPQSGSYKVGLSDLVLLAKAYGSIGNPLSSNWNPACDVAAPSGIIGLSDLVTLATDYGREWGNYTAATSPS
jgi:hypothetical protein